MRRFRRMNKTLAAAAVVGSLLVLVASGLALAFGVLPAGAKPKPTTSTTTTGTTGTTTATTTTSSTPR